MCLTEKGTPWEPDDPRQPLNIYGQTKYEMGELAVENNVEKFFIDPYCVGVRRKWEEFYKDDAESGKIT